jgi:O-antigen/teichoic acid export membrane protein
VDRLSSGAGQLLCDGPRTSLKMSNTNTEPPASRESATVPPLGAIAARGVAWTGAGQVARQLVQIGGLLVLSRLLGPGEFGLIGMAMFFIGLGQLFAEFGIGSAIVQARSPGRIELSSCFWLNLGIACALSLLLLVCSPLIGRFYGRSDLVGVTAALSFTLVLNSLQTVPGALLYRQMRFRALALALLAGSLCGTLLAIALAAAGAGVWALVGQPLAGALVTLVAMTAARRWFPSFEFSWQRVAAMASFGAKLFVTQLLGYANRNADSVLIGRVLGAQALGVYAIAVQIMLYPLQHVSSVFVRVLFPVLVQLKDDLPRLRSAYLRTVASIALITFPLMGGLFALAEDFVLVAFGASWIELVPVLKVLAWVGMMQSVATTTGTLFISTGNASLALRVTLVAVPVMVGGMAAGLPWGIVGVAVGYAAASFALFFYTTTVAFRIVSLKHAAFFASLAGPAAATAVMLATLSWLGPSVAGSWSAPSRLAAQVGLGTSIYALASLALNREQLRQLLATIRTLRVGA